MTRWPPPRRAVAASLPRRLAWLTVGALALVMTLGNIVSATGSGLGCPDWPLCHGRVIPPGGAEIWIEFRHRLAVPLFSALLVATAVVTWRRAAAPALKRLAAALVGLLVVQIVLGGVTVLLGLSPAGEHGASSRRAVRAGRAHDPLRDARPARTRLARCSRRRAERILPSRSSPASRQPGSRCCSSSWRWAGMFGTRARASPVPTSRSAAETCSPDTGWAGVHWLHRWLGVVLLGFFLHLARVSRRTALSGVGAAVAGLAVAQVTLGILTVLLRLPITVRASHAVVGYALWALLVWIAVRAGAWARASLDYRNARLASAAPRQTIDPLGSPSAAPRQTTAARGRSMGDIMTPAAPGPATPSSAQGAALTGVRSRAGAYAELSKFGIVLLVLVSAGAGFMLAAPLGPEFPWAAGLIVLLGVMLLSSRRLRAEPGPGASTRRAHGADGGPPAAVRPPLVRVRASSSRSWPWPRARRPLARHRPHRRHPRPRRRRLLQRRSTRPGSSPPRPSRRCREPCPAHCRR